MELSLKDISHILGGEIEGDENVKINTVGKLEEAKEGAISFLSNPKYENYIYTTKASAVIVEKGFVPKKAINTALLKVADPYSSFTALLEEYNRINSFSKSGVEEYAILKEDSEVGAAVYRGSFSYIGHHCKIGDNVKIYPHVYIGDHVIIGDNTILYPGARIHSNTSIGNYCTFHANCVVGSDGFGFAPQKDGSYKTIPQVGNVIIEDHVNIGANTVIDCATMGSTIIRKGVKLDNLIQVAHNVEIGKNTVIAAQTGISGSAKIGEQCVIAGQVGIVGHIDLPNKTTIGAQAGIPKGPKEENNILLGSPAIDRKDFIKSYAVFKKLPEMLKRVEELEINVINLRPDTGKQ